MEPAKLFAVLCDFNELARRIFFDEGKLRLLTNALILMFEQLRQFVERTLGESLR